MKLNKNSTFTQFLQYQIGGTYPLDMIFDNLNQEDILEEIENYKNQVSSDIKFTKEEQKQIDIMLDRRY